MNEKGVARPACVDCTGRDREKDDRLAGQVQFHQRPMPAGNERHGSPLDAWTIGQLGAARTGRISASCLKRMDTPMGQNPTSNVVEDVGIDRVVLDRFDQARGHGASERTAVNLAAWAWLERHPGSNIVQATQEVRRILTQHGRRLGV